MSVPPLLQSSTVSCGPTCLAAIAAYWEKDYAKMVEQSAPASLAKDFTAAQLAEMANELGLRAFTVTATLNLILDNVEKGRPVMVLIRKPPSAPTVRFVFNGIPTSALADWKARRESHWVIVVGYTSTRIIVHDPAAGRLSIPRSTFEEWWSARRRVALLLTG
ncbi:MAG: cysteine peptidase family C39 domain-containing protein [Verrucomicrobiota bacterium]